ncbi:MAG: hypothetical protein VKP57_02765 [Candidatus Sericytochromatia bacterium]|nr:hypothetical protein [Candidatus Sericytochromatia bacterium]
MVVLPDEATLQAALPWEARFLVAAKTLVGDQRIDLVMTTGARIRDDPFLQGILPQAVPLGTADGEVALRCPAATTRASTEDVWPWSRPSRPVDKGRARGQRSAGCPM